MDGSNKKSKRLIVSLLKKEKENGNGIAIKKQFPCFFFFGKEQFPYN